jgi:hypothetical protein
MFANFLNLFLNSAPSDNTSCFAGFVERTALELEPFDSTILLVGFLNDSANVAYTNLTSLKFLVLSNVSTTFNFGCCLVQML